MTNPHPGRKEKAQQREKAVLASARAIVREGGFLGMRISEVAKAAEVSVGTLYTHFESREDLIMALACESLLGRLQGFRGVFEDDSLGPAERLVVGVYVDFLYSVDHPELFAAEQLAATASVWDGGSDRRARELSWCSAEIMRLINVAARSAIDNGEFEPWDDRALQAESIDRGIWTLMAGSTHVNASVARMGHQEPAAVRVLPPSVRRNVAALFKGYGWTSGEPAADVERLATYASKLSTITTSSDGDDAPQSN